jgi:hypothetical protein
MSDQNPAIGTPFHFGIGDGDFDVHLTPMEGDTLLLTVMASGVAVACLRLADSPTASFPTEDGGRFTLGFDDDGTPMVFRFDQDTEIVGVARKLQFLPPDFPENN